MRISDWSSDVCSSDLGCSGPLVNDGEQGASLYPWRHRIDQGQAGIGLFRSRDFALVRHDRPVVALQDARERGVGFLAPIGIQRNRTSVGQGTSASGRVGTGGLSIINKRNTLLQ